MAKKNIKLSEEKQKEYLLSSGIKNFEEKIANGILLAPPKRRLFKIDERIQYGAMKEVYIREKFADGKYYRIECINVKRERDKPAQNEEQIVSWHSLFPYINKETCFRQEEKYYIRMLNSGIESLLYMVYNAGVDFDADYQRGHVWKQKDKVDLIDSIFNNIDIGKFVFVQRDFGVKGKLYEVLDGKQRITALCEFYEDKFKYKGFYYSELSNHDRNKFENHSIAYGYLENPNKEAIFETFIKLNTCGKPMASKHIEYVKQLLKEL